MNIIFNTNALEDYYIRSIGKTTLHARGIPVAADENEMDNLI